MMSFIYVLMANDCAFHSLDVSDKETGRSKSLLFFFFFVIISVGIAL